MSPEKSAGRRRSESRIGQVRLNGDNRQFVATLMREMDISESQAIQHCIDEARRLKTLDQVLSPEAREILTLNEILTIVRSY